MKVIVSGGGTGGHIYPALALIREIQKQETNTEVLYIGSEKGLESDIVKRAGIPFRAIEISGFKRKLSFDNVKTVARFLKGVSKSKKYIKEFKPDVVIGTGGYVCGPVVYAASKLGVPTVIHEQNSVPGLTNKFLSKYVDKVAVCFEQAEAFFPSEKVVMTGNPRASEVLNQDGVKGKNDVGLSLNKKSVLIVGGSRGARPINDALLSVIKEAGQKPYEFLYVTGDVHYERVVKQLEEAGAQGNVVVKPFLHNMPEVLSGVDLIVARAGATTLSEITALGLPSILVPSPYVTNNHQEKNARALSDNDAATLCLEADLTGERLLESIDEILLNEQKLKDMRAASKKLGMPNAATVLYELLKNLTK
ncbi:undecaprenyldiphospho-muramoylpentapeptide beta-N-acetylglucosaminyltransferase [Priestia filamentosa]|uniref:UDP-N-acetylglucosamine--N-acetylmuramyl-(pentapeptide) pyrophosphoryl-undecaprenol N-acetylglucosamine transferase n=1 Tax=Priestia filamentosa TaxID=1402861 RepID=A0A1X7D509_9BACI|nr:undecaprenyldiphospho-muramoylpentapeptide beta-N-acetylglucosaminyltransferase [Priestia filamentosa]AKO93922.1 undecaprenyldiphospho-muramoylpentapeptide beta-N-acetylglucosaminyltransferase [Priestia filamentosa]MDT3764165.1 undecaprenyldiphospho-muramoylpentapeptide beta-N-acetylglucosaminyltransferase [Priestia filamentosa]OXS71364.1 undecaprenyldiphospho-muramoylpentapeptide beta-N- acetylglucosaminyltransferase [Priestia filamentosa]RJS67007.1 undecaprenyldiphospho-muramoylpentapeptid